VGNSYTPSGYRHAFLWTAEEGMQDLGTLGGYDSLAVAINNSSWHAHNGLGLIADLQGPRFRVGELPDGVLALEDGATAVASGVGDETTDGCLDQTRSRRP